MPKPERCMTCGQIILPEEYADSFQDGAFHENPEHCVAAVHRAYAVLLNEFITDVNAMVEGSE